ncbi:MAG: M81 family metallopeptidase [Chloroflexota bacterium]|nr:M81 family metallopeptidase [Chloroflexota bacterium]
MTRILLGECKQEVSSFNPALSHYDDFTFSRGDELIAVHRGAQSEMSGALSVFMPRDDIELIPAFGARAITSGGTLAAADWRRLSSEFLDAVRAAPPVDAVYFSLHGAMSAEGEGDPEGYLLAETRAIIGERIPIVISLDLHGILTDRILEHTDALTVYHTYPHMDMFETGERAARLLLRILDEGVRPATAVVKIPALVRGKELMTETGIFGGFIRRSQAIEASAGGLSAGMFIGNPFTDVPDLRSNSIVVTDDPERSAREALALAEDFWAVRGKLHEDLTPLADAVQIAKGTTGGVVMMDAADATSSGASGDSNAILRALMESGYRGRTLVPIIDPRAAAAAFAAGVGNPVRTEVGGAFDPERFPPLTIEGQVHLLSDGKFIAEFNAMEAYSGPTAVIIADNYTLVLGSRPVSLHDRSFYFAHGQDPKQFDCVVVKSPHCKPHMYADWCARLINVDAPGSTSANLPYLGHTECARPIFPLDADVTFDPQVRVFRRTGD